MCFAIPDYRITPSVVARLDAPCAAAGVFDDHLAGRGWGSRLTLNTGFEELCPKIRKWVLSKGKNENNENNSGTNCYSNNGVRTHFSNSKLCAIRRVGDFHVLENLEAILGCQSKVDDRKLIGSFRFFEGMAET